MDSISEPIHERPLTEWEEEDVQNWLAELGFTQYSEQIKEHGISGEILCMLDHEALKEIGISSVGQRLTILKEVYLLKIAHDVPIDEDAYIPPSEVKAPTDMSANMTAFMEKIQKQLQEQDQRLQTLIDEITLLRGSNHELAHNRSMSAGSRDSPFSHVPLRNPKMNQLNLSLNHLPVPVPAATSTPQSAPLAHSHARSFSHSQLSQSHMYNAPGSASLPHSRRPSLAGLDEIADEGELPVSPYPPLSPYDLEQDISNLLETVQMQPQPKTAPLFPTSRSHSNSLSQSTPASQQPPKQHKLTSQTSASSLSSLSSTNTSFSSLNSLHTSERHALNQSQSQTPIYNLNQTPERPPHKEKDRHHHNDNHANKNHQRTSSNLPYLTTSRSRNGSNSSLNISTTSLSLSNSNAGSPTGSPHSVSPSAQFGSGSGSSPHSNSGSGHSPNSNSGSGHSPNLTTGESRSRSGSSPGGNSQLKGVKVSVDDPCWKVLPAALKKYHIYDDWTQYCLFITYGNVERQMLNDEKPLLIFNKLKEAGHKPVFQMRPIASNRPPINMF